MKGTRILQAVGASCETEVAGVTMDQFRSTGASHSNFVNIMARVAAASDMVPDGLSER